jgi:hypothetical protein
LATALAGSVALAAIPGPGGVIQGCYDSGGNLKVVEALSCPKNYTALRWNQQGIQGLPGADGEDGTDGTSPTVVQLVPGDPNCPAGGAAVTDAAGSSAYICSGQNGADGQPFAGTFTSSNGEYSISVANSGITIAHGASNSITLVGGDLTVHSRNLGVRTDQDLTVQTGGAAVLDATGNLSVATSGTAMLNATNNLSLTTSGTGLLRATGPLNLQGSVINMN